MNDKEVYKKLIEIIIDDSYAKEFEILRWLFRKYDECEEIEDV